jgi:hypothetical protein
MRAALLLLAIFGCDAPPQNQLQPTDGGSDLSSAPPDLAVALDDGGQVEVTDLAKGQRVGPQTLTFNLDAGVFAPVASHPSALVYIPANYDPTPPLSIVVYIHGFQNCVTNIVRDTNGSCTDGGASHNAYSLATQLENSGKNAILLAPEVAFEQSTGAPGNLADPTTFKKLLQESLDDIASVIGAHTVDEVGEIIVASHSGGYTVADDITRSNGIVTRETWMLDSLYSSTVTSHFEDWIKLDLGSLEPPYRRFATFYTILSGCQGTDCNSESLASDVKKLYPADAGVVIDEPNSATTWTDDVYKHGFLCKHSSLAHDDIPRYYFERLLRTSGLPNK